MLSIISEFFKSLNDNSHQSENILSLEVACAVLLCEVMRADSVYTEQEQNKLQTILVKHFLLTEAAAIEILEQAFELSENANDFYQFTSKVNQYYSLEERIKMVTLLWQVAYADGELASIEEHIIRKIADLLHLRHSEYIATKISAKQFHQNSDQ